MTQPQYGWTTDNPNCLLVPTQSGPVQVTPVLLGSGGTLPSGSATGQLLYWNETTGTWNVLLAQGAAGQVLQSQGPGQPPAFGDSPLVVPNIATLETLTGFANGEQVYVLSVGALWTLQVVGAPLTTDGITIVNAAISGGQWVRGPSYVGPAYQGGLRSAGTLEVFVNASTGNDENSGLTLAAPLATKAELVRRWGTSTPTFDDFTFILSLQAPDVAPFNDPWIATPICVNGGAFQLVAPLPAAGFTGTINAVTAKNVTTGVALQIQVTTSTGALAANMILFNTTHPSVAVAVSLFEGVWSITQPVTEYTGGAPAPANVDTWAIGDTIQGYVPQSNDIAVIACTPTGLPAGPSILVQNITVVDPAGLGSDSPLDVSLQSNLLLYNCVMQRAPTSPGGYVKGNNYLYNCVEQAPSQWGGTHPTSLNISGGLHASLDLSCGSLNNGAWLAAGIHALRNGVINGVNAAAGVFLPVGATLNCYGFCEHLGTIYGPGTVDAIEKLYYINPPATAFQGTVTLLLLTDSTGYSFTTSSGLTTVHQVALTVAALAAASGSAGFGGTAQFGGAMITDGNQN